MIDIDTDAKLSVRTCRRSDLVSVGKIETTCYGDGALPMLSLVQYFDLFENSFFVATRGGNCLGFVVAGASAASPTLAWILDVAVLPSEQRRGVAEALGLATKDRLRAAGVGTIRTTVAPSNQPSLKLCRKMGFIEVETVPDYFGPGEPRLVLELTLP